MQHNKYEVIDITATPGEKQLAIVQVRINDSFIARYKIVQKKNCDGVFPSMTCYKIPDERQDRFVEAFTIESKPEFDTLMYQILLEADKWKKKNKSLLLNYPITEQHIYSII